MLVKSPRISCIISCYNSEKYLAQALESVLAQTASVLEVIVADGGSQDSSPQIAARYPCVYVREVTAGPAGNRNLGLRHAQGDLLAFLDADDLWHREKLARQCERFNIRPDLQIVLSHAQVFWEDPRQQELYVDHPRCQPVPGYATTTMLARRQVFQQLGYFEEHRWYTDATEWLLRARETGVALEMMSDVLTFHRFHEGNLTKQNDQASREEFLDLVRASLHRRRAKG